LKLEKYYALLDDARWARGAELPRKFIGTWVRAEQTLVFQADGKMRYSIGADFTTVEYAFLDSEHIETTLPRAPRPQAFHVLCDDDEMYLVRWSTGAPEIMVPYKRRK
jgi:hypothetical protein